MAKCMHIMSIEEFYGEDTDLSPILNKILASGARVCYEPEGNGVLMFFDAEITAEGLQAAWADYMKNPDPLPRTRRVQVPARNSLSIDGQPLLELREVTCVWPDKKGTYPFLPDKDYPEPDNGDRIMGGPEVASLKVGVVTGIKGDETTMNLGAEPDHDKLTELELRSVIPSGFDGLWEHQEHVNWIFQQAMDAVKNEAESKATVPVHFSWEMRQEAIDNTRDAIQGMLFGGS